MNARRALRLLACGCERPERRAQTQPPEDVFRLGGGPTAEIGIEAVAVPRVGERPRLFEREHLAARPTVPRAPPVHTLLRPEEQDVGSGEDQVVVPGAERQEEVDHLAMV